MISKIHQFREKIAKRLKDLRPKAKDGRIAGGDMDAVLVELRKQYPDLPVWQQIPHPRDNHFNIYLLPLPLPLPETFKAAMESLHQQMSHEGVSPEYRKSGNQYEKRTTHLWVVEIQRWTYHPIGICSFLEEARRGEGEGFTEWLTFVWMNPAQRHHNVLRNSVPYFEKWHPRFIVGRDHAVINRSLKDYPDHLQNSGPTSTMW